MEAATRPPDIRERPVYCKGDLVEITSLSSNPSNQFGRIGHFRPRIAIIQRITESNYSGGRPSIVGVSREDGQRWLNPSNIRFHYNGFIKIENEESIPMICESLHKFESEVDEGYKSVALAVQTITKHHQKSVGLDRLIFCEDLAKQVFKTSDFSTLSAVQSYCLFKAVRDCGFLRDSQSKTIYKPLPARITKAVRLLSQADGEALKKLKKNLYDATFGSSGKPPSLDSELEKSVLVLLEFSTLFHDSNLMLNGSIDMMKELMTGIWPINRSSDILMFLKKIDRLPSTSLPLRQSVLCDENVHIEHDHSRVSVNEVPPTKPSQLAGEIIAIDSEATLEVDDALQLTEESDGSLWLHVHVADPARFIPPKSLLNNLVQSRVSSVYLPEQTLPMIPCQSMVSDCSLSEGKTNVTLTFSIKLDSNGDILNCKLHHLQSPGVTRLTYEQCDSILLDETNPRHAYLSSMLSMSRAHLRFREANGMLKNFMLPKPTVAVDSVGRVNVKFSGTNSPSQTLVSEAMIMAGRVAALFGQQLNVPLPFRYHLAPDIQLNTLDLSLLEHKLQLMDSLKPAAVDTRPRHHWAMGISCGYVKATSPIRRYLDLLTHQQLKSTVIHYEKAPYSESDLRSMLSKIYSMELYIKRLQQASIKYWLLVDLQCRILEKNDPVNTLGVYMGDNHFFLELYQTTFYIRLHGIDAPKYSTFKLRLTLADPHRMLIEAQVIN